MNRHSLLSLSLVFGLIAGSQTLHADDMTLENKTATTNFDVPSSNAAQFSEKEEKERRAKAHEIAVRAQKKFDRFAHKPKSSKSRRQVAGGR